MGRKRIAETLMSSCSLSLPTELWQLLAQKSREMGLSTSAFIREALYSYLMQIAEKENGGDR